MRRGLRRVHGRQPMYSVAQLGAPHHHTSPVTGRHRVFAAGRVLHVEIRTLESMIFRTVFFYHYLTRNRAGSSTVRQNIRSTTTI